ncbi:MAG: AbrB/MazE/SpoVT family DNA-binding domain-containing protein [Deltaproteobacteria bacterium]|nr:AbrB/MazE/SpoVT family DNA-binding domain-containing protein [Deltaproteobacteria bacterium]RLB79782.1 MAG: AbrB family transcriptional regulator [Deltaproteobacteria bacterium]
MRTIITSKYQTTIPKAIRERLRLSINDTIEWKVQNGKIVGVPMQKKFLKYKNTIKTGVGNIEDDIRSARKRRAQRYL